MRHRKDHRKLSRTASHRRAVLRNLVTALFEYERIETTVAKAKESRRLAERLITFAKRGDLAARRHVARFVMRPAVTAKLFATIAPWYKERAGGYTRIIRLGRRLGDAGETAYLELVKTTEQKDKERQDRIATAEAREKALKGGEKKKKKKKGEEGGGGVPRRSPSGADGVAKRAAPWPRRRSARAPGSRPASAGPHPDGLERAAGGVPSRRAFDQRGAHRRSSIHATHVPVPPSGPRPEPGRSLAWRAEGRRPRRGGRSRSSAGRSPPRVRRAPCHLPPAGSRPRSGRRLVPPHGTRLRSSITSGSRRHAVRRARPSSAWWTPRRRRIGARAPGAGRGPRRRLLSLGPAAAPGGPGAGPISIRSAFVLERARTRPGSRSTPG